MFGKILRRVGLAGIDERAYEVVAKELAGGDVRPGLWAKALAESEYEEQKAKARYMKLRAAQVSEEMLAEAERAKLRQSQTREVAERARFKDGLRRKAADDLKARIDQSLKEVRKHLRDPVRADVYAAEKGIDAEEVQRQLGAGLIRGYVAGGQLYIDREG